MAEKWIEVRTEVETIDWRGNPLVLKGVKALQNVDTGRFRYHPYELAQAEIANIAERFGLLPRDVVSFMILFAKPGTYKKGEVFYRYHLQKMLFYLWKELGNNGYYETMPRDEFLAKNNGPVPMHMDDDLQRFCEQKYVTQKEEHWHPEYEKPSKRITLTEKGMKISNELWKEIPEPYRVIAIKVKERIHPMEPEKIRHIVHMEYPEYRDTYIENDIE